MKLAGISIRCLGAIMFCWVLLNTPPAFSASPGAALPPRPEAYESHLDRDGVWRQANEYYREAKFEEALAGYLYLHAQGVRNGYLYFNLGNASFALDRLAEAILWYERALRYIPRHEDLRVNLEYARSQLADEEFRAPRYGGVIGVVRSIHQFFNLREIIFAALLLLWLTAIAWSARILAKREVLRNGLGIPCWILTFAFILFLLCSIAKYYEAAYIKEAVVSARAIEVMTAPGLDFPTAFTLHEGTKVRILHDEDGWVRIALPGAPTFTGWMPNDSVIVI